jgi:hypothetical protein
VGDRPRLYIAIKRNIDIRRPNHHAQQATAGAIVVGDVVPFFLPIYVSGYDGANDGITHSTISPLWHRQRRGVVVFPDGSVGQSTHGFSDAIGQVARRRE